MTYPGSDQSNPPEQPSAPPPFAPIVPPRPAYDPTPTYKAPIPSSAPPSITSAYAPPNAAPVHEPAASATGSEPTPPTTTYEAAPEQAGAPLPWAVAAPQPGPVAAPQPRVYASGVQPVPAPPTYDPNMAQQFSAPPVSVPYGYSGIPMQMSGMPMAVEPKRSKVGVVILSVLTTLFILATGVMTTLFLQQRGQAQKANGQVNTLSTELGETKTKANAAQRELDNTKRDLTDAKAAAADAANEKKIIVECVNAIYDYFEAVNKSQGQETADVRAKENTLDNKCDAADKFL
jgi:hypothetical protein